MRGMSMKGYEPSSYGEKVADIYDEYVAEVNLHVEATVSTLAEFSRSGRVLELGIGTGRVALPLAMRGLEVYGIDASEAMVERLRAKPGGDRVDVTIGDFADVKVEGTFSLIFVVFNTFFAMTTQEEQTRCFARVAEHLDPNGVFVIEAFVPDLGRFDRNQRVSATRIEASSVVLSASIHDPLNQTVAAQDVLISEDGIRLIPTLIRYAWPSELDLMAANAGLRLRDRWAGWRREPFAAQSRQHVSVYERA
jgi:SAM-dependent methyltransferase